MDQRSTEAGDTPGPATSALRVSRPRRLRWPLLFSALGVAAFVAVTALARTPSQAIGPLPLALVMPLSGAREAECAPMVNALVLKVEELNGAGGIGGRPIQLLKFDDKGDPTVARRVAKEVAAGPALAVIGHFSNDTTDAAAQVYRDAGLLAVGATATADRLPVDNPYFYRLCCDDTAQGWAMAVYTSRVLKSTRASILYSDEESGLSQLGAFKKTYPIVGGEIANRWAYNTRASVEERMRTIEQVAQAVKDDSAGVVLLAVSPDSAAREALLALRRLGSDPVIFGNSTMGTEAFAESLRSEPEEKKEPGFFTKHAYATTFVILDTANDRMSAFVADYRKAFGKAPPPRSVKYSEAGMVLADALRRAEPAGTKWDLASDRRKVRDRVAALDSPKHAFEGITGPLYFDEYQTLPEPARITRFVKGELSSAPLQIAAVRNPELLDLEKEVEAGNIFPFGVRYFWTQQVVFTGIDFREIGSIDPAKGTFNADFYLWFRYAGSDAILQIDLNAAGDKSPYDPQTPIAAKEINGMKYRLYNVKGAFDADLDFHNYPFDSQALQLQLSNPRLPRESVIYAIDSVGLKLPRRPGDAFRVLPPPNWKARRAVPRYPPNVVHARRPGPFRRRLRDGVLWFQGRRPGSARDQGLPFQATGAARPPDRRRLLEPVLWRR